jgi:hypothetical protein
MSDTFVPFGSCANSWMMGKKFRDLKNQAGCDCTTGHTLQDAPYCM